MVAICIPSRGLIFSQTVQSVFDGMSRLNSLGIATQLFTSHDLPIPQSHDFLVSSALRTPAKRLFIIEEDHYIFPDTFVALATSDDPIITCQYNDKNGSPFGIIHYNEKREVLWAGLGATCINREVFEKISSPYFRTDHMYKVEKKKVEDDILITKYQEIEPKTEWSESEKKFIKVRDEYVYGGLDVDFYTRARKAGYIAKVLPGHKVVHFSLVKLGEQHINNGCHIIKQV